MMKGEVFDYFVLQFFQYYCLVNQLEIPGKELTVEMVLGIIRAEFKKKKCEIFGPKSNPGVFLRTPMELGLSKESYTALCNRLLEICKKENTQSQN